jgi:hypothetical protein
LHFGQVNPTQMIPVSFRQAASRIVTHAGLLRGGAAGIVEDLWPQNAGLQDPDFAWCRTRIFREDWVADFAFIDGKGRRECGFAATTAFEDLLTILSSMVRVHATRLDGCGLQGRVKIYVKSCATDQQVGAAIGTATVAI